jgi:hypothetical protein
MDNHDRWADRIARPDVEDIEGGATDFDLLTLGRIGALQDKDTGLRDERQNSQRRHDGYRYH